VSSGRHFRAPVLCLKHCFVALDEDKLTGIIDLIICLGGDGTLLYASTLFQVN